jgi:hypothetical protein
MERIWKAGGHLDGVSQRHGQIGVTFLDNGVHSVTDDDLDATEAD